MMNWKRILPRTVQGIVSLGLLGLVGWTSPVCVGQVYAEEKAILDATRIVEPEFIVNDAGSPQLGSQAFESQISGDAYSEVIQSPASGPRSRSPRQMTNKTVSIFGSWGFQDPNNSFGARSFYSRDTLEDGYSMGIATGKRWSPRLRTELELSYRRNELGYGNYFYNPYVFTSSFVVDPIFFGGNNQGEVHTYAGMANFYYDFDRVSNRFLTPYVGVGLGMAYVDADVTSRGSGETISNESMFAFQAIGGVSAKLSRAASLFVEYRFFRTAKDDFFLPESAGPFSSYSPDSFEYSVQDSNLVMGLRFTF